MDTLGRVNGVVNGEQIDRVREENDQTIAHLEELDHVERGTEVLEGNFLARREKLEVAGNRDQQNVPENGEHRLRVKRVETGHACIVRLDRQVKRDPLRNVQNDSECWETVNPVGERESLQNVRNQLLTLQKEAIRVEEDRQQREELEKHGQRGNVTEGLQIGDEDHGHVETAQEHGHGRAADALQLGRRGPAERMMEKFSRQNEGPDEGA